MTSNLSKMQTADRRMWPAAGQLDPDSDLYYERAEGGASSEGNCEGRRAA